MPLDELKQALEREWSQTIVGIIRLVCHIYIDRVVQYRIEELATLNAGQVASEATWIFAPIDGVSV